MENVQQVNLNKKNLSANKNYKTCPVAVHANHVCCKGGARNPFIGFITQFVLISHQPRCQNSEAHTFDAFGKSVFEGKSFKACRWCKYFTKVIFIWPILSVLSQVSSAGHFSFLPALNIILLGFDLKDDFLASVTCCLGFGLASGNTNSL